MNVKKLIPLAMMPMLFASCNYHHSIWKNSFSYKSDVAFDLDSSFDGKKSTATIIDEQIKADNINWDQSGTYSTSYEIVHFSKHQSAKEIKSCLKEMAKPTFDLYYTGFKIEIGSKEEKKVRITQNNETKEFTAKPYEENEEYIYFLDSQGETQGHCTSAPIPNHGWYNGKLGCLEVDYGKTNKMKFFVKFKTLVEGYEGLEWDVYAKIAN